MPEPPLKDKFDREALNLLGAKPDTLFDELWKQVDAAPAKSYALADIEKRTRVDKTVVGRMLADRLQRVGATAPEVRPTKYWLDVVVFGVVVLLVVLVLRAHGVLRDIAPPYGIRDQVLIAAHDLEVGHVLQPSDVKTTMLVTQPTYLPTDAMLIGYVVARAVPAGRPLQRLDVHRVQAVAAKDIAPGTVISTDAISETASAYTDGASTHADEVVGRKTRYGLQRGQVVLSSMLEAAASTRQQVIVRAAGGLPAFRPITAADIDVSNTLSDTAAFTDKSQVIGRYALQPLRTGSVISATQLSETQILTSTLAGRKLLTVPIQAGAVSSTLLPGRVVSLLVSPRDAGASAQAPPPITEVVVWAVLSGESGSSLTIGVTDSDYTLLSRWLGSADLYVLEEP